MTPHPWLKRLATATLSLGALSLVAIVANLIVLTQLYPLVIAFEPLPPWTNPAIAGIVGSGHLALGVFHLAALTTLGWQIRILQRANVLRAALFVVGVLSLIFLLSNVTLLGDIGKEYKAGLQTNSEWIWVFLNHGLHLLFVLLGTLVVVHSDRVIRAGAILEGAELDEAVFLSAHYVGIFCGALGLSALALLVAIGFPARYFAAAAGVFSLICLAPYGAAAGAWAALARLHSSARWIDEKQSLDLAHAAHRTLAVALPVLAAGYVAQGRLVSEALVPHLWFPVVGFTVLLVFSSFTVRFSRRA